MTKQTSCWAAVAAAIAVTPLLLSGCNARPDAAALASTAARLEAVVVPADQPAASALVPKAVTPQTEFKFDVMEPQSRGTYTFAVRNEGDAPLKLEVGDTSCKCTAGAVDGDAIAPGEETTVTLTWNTGSKVSYYRQWAEIKTNDPARPRISFNVEGPVRNDFRCEPELLSIGELVPGEAGGVVEAIIVSPHNNQFEIVQAASASGAFGVETELLSSDELQDRDAVRGYRLKVSVPDAGKLSKGDINDLLQVSVKANPQSEETQELSIPIEGRVLGKIAVAGPMIDNFGWIDFGTKNYGQGARTHLRVIVRDDEPELKVSSLKIEPQWLKVQLSPSPNSTTGRVYDLLVEVPPETPACAHRGDKMGTIRFDFDHPRIPKLELKVAISIRATSD